jgi:hypothetical protein
MSAATCAAVAQLLPVLLVVLIAERIVVPGKRRSKRRTRRLIAASARLFVDLVLAVTLVVGIFVALAGVENDGLQGQGANTVWVLAIALTVGVVYRWFLLSPVVYEVGTSIANWYVRLLERAFAPIEGFSEPLATALRVGAEFLFGVAGGGVDFLADTVVPAIRNGSRSK